MCDCVAAHVQIQRNVGAGVLVDGQAGACVLHEEVREADIEVRDLRQLLDQLPRDHMAAAWQTP